MTDDDEDRDVLTPPPAVEHRPVPGFPGYVIGSDLVVWRDLRRPGHDPRSPGPRWVRLWPKRIGGLGRHFVRLRHGGRDHVRSLPVLFRAAFSPRPDLWLDRIGPKPPRPADMPRAAKETALSPPPAAAVPPAVPAPDRPSGPVELKTIPGFERYAVGSDRSVWSSAAHRGRGPRPGEPPAWRRLRLRDGGKRVALFRDGRKTSRVVEHLYRSAFGDAGDGTPGGLSARGPYQEQAVGSASGMARLDETKVVEARRLRREGWVYADLAERYGVTAGTMLAAVSGRTWRHVPPN